mgnify:CR=1 FL=1|jgi:ABC-type multidrug transport system ATPase subunit
MQIQLKNCSKSYNHQPIIDALSLTVSSGSNTAVLGNNGSGKSTLSLLLAGQIEPNSGTISWSLNGKEIQVERVFSEVSLSSPALILPEEFTIEELIQFHTRFKPVDSTFTAEHIIDICSFDSSIKNKAIKNFSSGMKQRIKLCLAVYSNTSLLILDEPTENLDAHGIELYQKLIQEIKPERTVIIATNRESDYTFCDNFIRL